MELLYLPLTLYVLFIGSIRTRRLFYFAATNPKVPLGGFAADSKAEILNAIPLNFKPRTILVEKNTSIGDVLLLLEQRKCSFPLFVKPNIGESGFLAKKIETEQELVHYHESHLMDYLIQDFINDQIELSILIYTTNKVFKISSITERRHLSLTGDGRSTISQLICLNERAKWRLKPILEHCIDLLDDVPAKNTVIKPVALGNWDYGAEYIERSDLIQPDLITFMDQLNTTIGLFNYARYDIMTSSYSDLSKGRFTILEINGVKGEPIHIYDKKYSLIAAYREIFKHWEYILKISQQNIKAGFICPSIMDGFKLLQWHYFIKKQSLKNRHTK